MRPDDVTRLRHMLEAAKEAAGYMMDKDRGHLEKDRVLLLALMKSIEIIGEAAAKVSHETKSACADIPWREIIAMRNRLIHAYMDVDPDILWHAVIDDLPRLIRSLEKVLSSTA
jgi:uncharacterized protein with HEPN domain